jgi:hypothetical protein
MPTRSELRTLQDRLQETRRENKRLRRDLVALQRQVAALVGGDSGQTPGPGAQGETLGASAPQAVTRAGAAKKTVARKKTTVKPANG